MGRLTKVSRNADGHVKFSRCHQLRHGTIDKHSGPWTIPPKIYVVRERAGWFGVAELAEVCGTLQVVRWVGAYGSERDAEQVVRELNQGVGCGG